MKNLKETIKLFQDIKNNKTTIVVYNMSPQTLQKVKDLLFAEVMTVSGVECVDPVTHQDTETNNMVEITPAPAYTPESAREYFLTNLPNEYRQDPAKQITWLIKCVSGTTVDANLLNEAQLLIKQIIAAAVQSSYNNGEPNDAPEVLNGLRNVLFVTRNYLWDAAKVCAQYGYGDISSLAPEEADKMTCQVIASMDSQTLRAVLQTMSQ